ncbi:NAD-dependent epimerase/dehydratase [Verrucomicrobia bacterium]|nr:NAD-dependent epimerase/dehydratase [Verrucomicrobiota bacterium]
MKLLVTGVCGFVGSTLVVELKRRLEGVEIIGVDNLSRPGSEANRGLLKKHGVRLVHGDVRLASDLESLPKTEWVIDAAANPSVLAGVAGATSSRQLLEHNLGGTMQLLEYCKHHAAGIIMLSTSRIYSARRLSDLPVEVQGLAFVPRFPAINEPGFSERGVAENFSTQFPLSLYGAAKLASELLILEYGSAFDFPVQINRCGVLAGAGQFGKPDQGIFSFWIHSYCHKRPLKYIGFGGAGHQVRDCLHPADLATLVATQLKCPERAGKTLNVSGGTASATSLAQVSEWCRARFGAHPIGSVAALRPYDVPWLVLDSTRAEAEWNWRPAIKLEAILEEIARHAEAHPDWLEISSDT